MYKKRIGFIGASLTLALLALVVSLGWLYRPAQAEPQAGDISGTVAYYGGITDTADLYVAAHPVLGDPPVASTQVASPGGPFTIASLPDGDYYLSVFLDLSGGGGPPEPWEPEGFYDVEGDGVADAVTVAGGDVSDVHIALGGPWMPLGGPMMSGGQANAIAVDPDDSDGDTVYAAVAPVGTYDSGPSTVYKTEDGGQSWSEVFSRDSAQIHALASGGEYVFAGVFNPGGNTRPVLYVNSGFGGGSWTGVVEFDYRGVIADVAAHPIHFDSAIAGGWAYDDQDIQHGVVYSGFGSLDSNWSQILDVTFPNGEAMVNAVMVHPVTPTLVYASVQNTASPDTILYRSDDAGVTWGYTVTLPNANILSLVANTTTPNLIYAGSGNGPFSGGPSQVWRSEDAGLTWSIVNDAGTQLAYEPPSTVYAIADWGEVWVSGSDGAAGTWSSIGGVWSPADLDIDLNVTTPTLYAGTWDGGIQKSASGGVGWEAVNGDIETPVAAVDIDVDPANPKKMFVAAECGMGWMTEDGGESWTEATGACAGAFAINPDDPDVVYLGEFNDRQGAVLRSNDGGMSFTPVYTAPFIMPDGSGGDEAIFDLAIAPSMTTTVFAAGADNPNWQGNQAVAMRSLDDGASWTVVFTLPEMSSIRVVSIDPTDDDVVYLGGEDCNTGGPFCWHFIERTTDGGDTWTRVLSNTHGSVASIVVDYQKPNVLYAATNNYEVYKSSDGGDSWTIVRQNPPDPSGYLLALDPRVPSHVYLGGHGYIAESVDGGLTWTEWDAPINQGTPSMEPRALAVDFGAVSQTLYAGFTGVWAHGRGAPQPGEPLTISMAITPTTPVYANGDNLLLYEGWVYDQYGNWVAAGTPLSVTYATEWMPPIVAPKQTADGFFMGGWMDVSNPGVVTFTAVAENGATGMVTGEFLYNPPLTLTVEAPEMVPVGETAVLSITAPGLHGGIASNGTVISLTTSLGQVDAAALTVEGVATATVTSESGGIATVTLASGEVEVIVLIEFVGEDLYLPLVTRP